MFMQHDILYFFLVLVDHFYPIASLNDSQSFFPTAYIHHLSWYTVVCPDPYHLLFYILTPPLQPELITLNHVRSSPFSVPSSLPVFLRLVSLTLSDSSLKRRTGLLTVQQYRITSSAYYKLLLRFFFSPPPSPLPLPIYSFIRVRYVWMQ